MKLKNLVSVTVYKILFLSVYQSVSLRTHVMHTSSFTANTFAQVLRTCCM